MGRLGSLPPYSVSGKRACDTIRPIIALRSADATLPDFRMGSRWTSAIQRSEPVNCQSLRRESNVILVIRFRTMSQRLPIRRCALRRSVAGFYDPAKHIMQLTFDRSLGDPSPAVTSHHEMVHKDLTESTVGGYLDRFLSSTVSGLASEAKETIENWVDGLVQRSMLTHEGTALFISLAQPALFGVPHLDQILAAIPEDYSVLLRTIESRLISTAELRALHLDIDDALSFNVGVSTIANSIASLALDHIYSPNLDNADVAGVETVLGTVDADARFPEYSEGAEVNTRRRCS
jgi:hypothetical protein